MPQETTLPVENQRFLEMWEEVKDRERLNSDGDLLGVLGYKARSMISEIRAGRAVSKKLLNSFCNHYGVSRAYITDGIEPKVLNKENNKNNITPTYRGGNAQDLGAIDDELTEENASGNEFIDAGAGNYVMLTPLIEEYAQAGYLGGFANQEYIEELPRHPIIVTSKHKGVYRSFRVVGHSMSSGTETSINEGDIVTGRLIDQAFWKSKFHIHRFKEYIIVHKEGILVKEISEHDIVNGKITIHSTNPDKEKYPDDVIDLKDVNQIFNVIQVTKPR